MRRRSNVPPATVPPALLALTLLSPLVLFAACSGGAGPASVCDGLDETACEGNAECRSLIGGPADEYCAGNLDNSRSRWAGCAMFDQPCGDAPTCASDPATGERVMFPDTCVPEGWLPCSCSVPEACTMGGEDTPAGQLCVRGALGVAGESVRPDEAVRIEVTPAGCFGSGCVTVFDSVCEAARAGTDITVSSLFCIGDSGAEVCQPDCSGAGYSSCYTDALPDGDYTITLDGLSVTFTVPSELPFGGVCDGDPLG